MSVFKQSWRLFLPSRVDVGSRVSLPEDEHHYAHHVLRLQTGERVEVGDGAGFVAEAVITRSDKRATEVEVESWIPERRFPCEVTLFLALPKPATLEEVVSLVAELGVSKVVVFRTRRCQSKAPVKVEKLERAALEALRITKGFRAPSLTSIEDFGALQGLLSECGPVFLCDESPERQGSDLGAALQALPADAATRVALVVGPEASFDASERESLVRWGARSVSLGPLILRVPTAVAYAVGVTMSRFNARYAP